MYNTLAVIEDPQKILREYAIHEAINEMDFDV